MSSIVLNLLINPVHKLLAKLSLETLWQIVYKLAKSIKVVCRI